jgi:hypothetical protein
MKVKRGWWRLEWWKYRGLFDRAINQNRDAYEQAIEQGIPYMDYYPGVDYDYSEIDFV